MSNKICTLLIKNLYSTLTPAEKKIADYILLNKDKVLNMTVAELAAATGVAGSAVIRLCKTLGFSGFSQLKISLAQESMGEYDVLIPAVKKGDSMSQVFHKVFNSSIKTLQDTLKMVDVRAVTKAVNMIKDSKRIEFYGVGTSSTIAMDAYYRLMRIGYPAYFATDSHILRISSSNLDCDCTSVGISHCGRTKDTVEALKLAKENGAKTIAITSYKNSPICDYADVSLVVYSDEIRYPIEAVSSRIAHIAILDSLCVALSLENYDRTLKNVDKMNKLFASMRIK